MPFNHHHNREDKYPFSLHNSNTSKPHAARLNSISYVYLDILVEKTPAALSLQVPADQRRGEAQPQGIL